MKIKYAVRRKDAQGFSLIEPLLSLMIFFLFLSLTTKIQQTIAGQLSKTHKFNTAQLELNQLYEKEAAHSSYEHNDRPSPPALLPQAGEERLVLDE